MSHNICHRNYPEKVNKKEVQAEWDEYVRMEDWQEGASGLANPIRWIDKTYSSYEEASNAIKEMDRGWYDQLAVKYISREQNKNDEKLKALNEEVSKAYTEYSNREKKNYPKTLSANLITCQKCGSKLAKTYLNSNFCPVCRNDLRPEHIMKSILAAKNKWQRAQTKVKEYEAKHGKENVMWLVKIEYHT